MNKIELDKVMKNLIQLKEQPINEILRTGSMLCLGFGDKVTSKTVYKTAEGVFDVKESLKSKYALHIDGLFRISFNNKILLTQDDIFKPSVALQDNDFYEETFQWDIKGHNKFDEKIANIFDLTKSPLLVKAIQVNKYGDLNINLSNNYDIDVFIDTSEAEECWRFFEIGNNETPHIVIMGCEYCEE
ncbi:MAG: hypothetical protein E7404_06640 [Ruminococcaceae bacterium]|nr:hypothetical protein [Oscillospiraceae bacterium]